MADVEPGSAGVPIERSTSVQPTARSVGLAALAIMALDMPPPLIGPVSAGEAWTPAILTDPALADTYLPDFSYAGYHWGEGRRPTHRRRSTSQTSARSRTTAKTTRPPIRRWARRSEASGIPC